MKQGYDKHTITYIGITNFRNTNKRFGIKDEDRFGHIYCIGKTGMGKSTLLKTMAVQDIQKGKGLAVLDPHGDVAEELQKHIPEWRRNDIIYFNPSDISGLIAFNPLYNVNPKYHHLVVSGLISTFKKIWSDSWGPRMEYVLRFSLLTLLEVPESTLLDIQPLLTDEVYRRRVIAYVCNKHTRDFWLNEFDKYTKSFRAEVISPILNKIGVFLSSPVLRNVVGQKIRGLRMQYLLDKGKVFIVNLSKGSIGEDISSILGSMIVTSIQLAALHRAEHPEVNRKPFYLYIDECHSFLSLSVIDILAEARKYKLSLFMANQFLDQLDIRIQQAIFGNVGTLISFRVGAKDAELLAHEFEPVLNKIDLINQPSYSLYIKLLIDGVTSCAFSARMEKYPI